MRCSRYSAIHRTKYISFIQFMISLVADSGHTEGRSSRSQRKYSNTPLIRNHYFSIKFSSSFVKFYCFIVLSNVFLQKSGLSFQELGFLNLGYYFLYLLYFPRCARREIRCYCQFTQMCGKIRCYCQFTLSNQMLLSVPFLNPMFLALFSLIEMLIRFTNVFEFE